MSWSLERMHVEYTQDADKFVSRDFHFAEWFARISFDCRRYLC